MSQAMQSQPVFVDIHMNNGHRLGTWTFKDIMNGRFNGDMQLAFEQYLTDFKNFGTAYRTYRYMIVNGNMLLLHDVLNPFPAGPALAAPVTQLGRQNANARTQASGNQTPYASQLNQSVAISLGPVDPSAVQNIRCPPASTAQRSVSLPRQLNPRASEFKLGSAANSLAASARPLALPTANSAPARPPCLPVTQQPQFAPSNAHPGFFAPDTTRATTGPSMLTTPYLSPTHSHDQAVPQQAQLTSFNARQGDYNPDTLSRSAGAAAWAPTLITPYSPILSSPVPAIPQQPQLAPCNHHRGGLTLNTRLGLFDDDGGQAAEAPASPSALANNFFTASRDSWMASPSPLDLAAVSPSETNNQHLSPRQWGRRTSEHSSDASSHSSSVQDQSSCPWCLHHGYRCLHRRNSVSNINRSSYHTAKISFKANTTKITSHGPQKGEADTGVALSPSPPQFQSRDDTDNIEERRLRQNLRPSTAIRGKMPPWDPLSEYLSGQHEAFYSNLYKRWRRSAPPELGISGFYDHLQSLPEGLRWYHDVFGLRNPQGPVTTPPPWSSNLPSDTVLHHTKSPMVGNGTNRSREMAEVETSAPRTLTRNGPDTSSRNDIPLPTSTHPQLQHGEEGSEHGGSSFSDPKSAIEVQLEARSSVEEEEEDDRRLQQRLNGLALFFSDTIEEVRKTIREMEAVSG